MTKDEALRLALEALENAEYGDYYKKELNEAITAIKEALANEALEKMAENARELGLDYEPAKEPVAWEQFYPDMGKPQLTPPQGIYYTPPQRTWVGLTDEEIKRIGKLDLDSNYFGLWYDFAKAIEAKLKEKNNG
jgi:hypothetical protein